MHHGEIKLVRTLFMVTRGQGNKNCCHTISTFPNWEINKVLLSVLNIECLCCHLRMAFAFRDPSMGKCGRVCAMKTFSLLTPVALLCLHLMPL